jgi:hypothetical protein
VKKYCRVWQAAGDNIAHENCTLVAKVYKYTLIIRGVSKTFGEWYKKTNKTEDTNKLT